MPEPGTDLGWVRNRSWDATPHPALSPLLLPPQECRLAEIESTQAQLKDTIQNLQLLPRTSESQSQPLPLKAPASTETPLELPTQADALGAERKRLRPVHPLPQTPRGL